MTKEELERYLADGLTLREIGERTGKHLTTVGYWVKKHGLRAVFKDKYAAKGGDHSARCWIQWSRRASV